MTPVSLLPVITITLIALFSCHIFSKYFGTPSVEGRFASIDGLRGFLAFFVFLHHSCIWYFYLHLKGWNIPPSNLYTHLGQSSVSMFFMITGFLFFSKIIDGKEKEIDWTRLLVSRVLRLSPLYFFSMTLIFMLAYYETGGVFNQPIQDVYADALKWFTFRIFGHKPNIEGINDAFCILAGVTLTLRHEWYFYFSLPFIAFVMRTPPPILLSFVSFVALLVWRPHGTFLLAFLCGMLAARLARIDRVCLALRTDTSSIVAISLLTLDVLIFPVPYESKLSILLIGAAFVIVACGNSLFGLLVHASARTLGEISYSIYLLHGLILFIAFKYLLITASPQQISPYLHWSVVAGLTPILIAICSITYRHIESPAMRKTTVATQWVQTKLLQHKSLISR